MKIYRICKLEKFKSDFSKSKTNKDRLRSECKLCLKEQRRVYHKVNAKKISKQRKEHYKVNVDKIRNSHFIHYYGITLEEYDSIFKDQKGCCAICGIYYSKLKKKLCVDHNHLTGKVRGLLCNACNQGIGYLQENNTTLLSALKYLEKHEFKK